VSSPACAGKNRLGDLDEVTLDGWYGYRTEVDAMMSSLEADVDKLERHVRGVRPTT
jgi:hypothetical protein